jgi:hypothetical protein
MERPTLQQFKDVYQEALRVKAKGRPAMYTWYDGTEESIRYVVDKMVNAIAEGHPKTDWFRDNPALKAAARKLGFKTSPEFKRWIFGQLGKDVKI